MPYRRKYRKKRRRTSRRHFRRKRRSKYSRLDVVRFKGPSMFPDRINMKLKYSQFFSHTGSGLELQQFRGNSLFDPDLTGTGHQPNSYDQMSVLYSKYVVHACSIKIRINGGSATFIGVSALLATSDTAYSASSLDEVREQAYSQNRIIANTTGTPQSYMKMYNTSKSIFGKRIIEEEYAALIGDNPDIIWVYNIYSQDIATIGNAHSIFYVCDLTFYASFYDRNSLDPS